MTKKALAYRRILLKYSGEVLCGQASFGVEPGALNYVVDTVKECLNLGVEVAIVLGGGNFFRGKNLVSSGFDQVKADQMGMLATVMNGIALEQAFVRQGVDAVMMSAVAVTGIADPFQADKARALLDQGKVVICAGGIANPYFTTDTAACLRGVELQADVVLKATKVDGVYSGDPKKNPDATRYHHLSFAEVIEKKLEVMDMTAICLCQQQGLPIQVFDMSDSQALRRIVEGEQVGTIVGAKHVI
ncbi:MAG: UMP kinase [Gammaproteobacteria bacterium]|nr:UMP kinase [Gammaproteobacteria bacterium]